MGALGLQRIEFKAIRFSDDEVLAIVGDEFAFSRTDDSGGVVKR